MQVLKRSGQYESVDFNKITKRLTNLCNDDKLTKLNIDPVVIAQKVVSQIQDKISTHDLDVLASEISISLITTDLQYGDLASRILVSDMHKGTSGNFKSITQTLFDKGLLSHSYYHNAINIKSDFIDYYNDYKYDYFGIKTLQRAYLMDGERPQDLILRVAIELHNDDIDEIKETYHMMSNMLFIHATPTLFNAGTLKPQMSSCFLIAMKDDSIDGIYDTLKECALISKTAGGIGMHIHNIRAKGATINCIKNAGSGIIPMLKNFNATARYVDQGSRRPGSIAVYLSTDHPDIFDFLDMKKNTGDEEERCRDLFSAVWISDLFMKRVEANEKWSLFCPHSAPGLSDVYGDDYEKLYIQYENEKKFKKQINAQELWFAILESQIETGNPYMLYKDSINNKTNQNNLESIVKSSNLCCEITEVSTKDETAVCNLASIALPKFISNNTFDFDLLLKVTRKVTRNLNYVIDKNYYPTPETKKSNMRHRPIGIGVQGLADAYQLLDLPFDSEETNDLNKRIFETIYYGALTESMELAKKLGPYETFKGSHASNGILQFHLWNQEPYGQYDWKSLIDSIKTFGLRNSLLVAPMPTASTSQILGNNEAFEPYTSNIYLRRTLAGEFVVINKHLIKKLNELDLWSIDMKNKIIANNGSIKNINGIPDNIKNIYKTVWEIKQRALIDQAASRGIYICQSQSMNLFIDDPTMSKLSSMHFYSWKQGLKTGIYYLRTKPVADAIKFTICETCSA